MTLKYFTEKNTEAEFKEFELRFKFKQRFKYGWFHLKLYSMFQDFSWSSYKIGFGGFKTRLKFIKFGHRFLLCQIPATVKF